MQTKTEILQACKVEGTVIKLPNIQLERKLYQEVAKALELIGGKWKGGKVAGFEFSEDPSELLKMLINPSSPEQRSVSKGNPKKEFQFFETPAEIANWLVSLANLNEGMLILEPSAGRGAIIQAIQYQLLCNKINARIECFEIMEVNRIALKNISYANLIGDDFLNVPKTAFNKYDRIIANPPFSKNQDIDHVRHMYECLKPGGRLVSVMSKHWTFASNRKETQFREWLKKVNAETHIIPAGAFKKSGTMIESIIVVINKPSLAERSGEPVEPSIVNSKSANSKSMPLVCTAALRLEVYPPNARALVMQYFIGGGKINPDALQSLFGNKAGKSVESERKARFTWCSKTDGKTIDQIAHFLWEQNLDLDRDENIESEQFRDAVEEVILSYNSTVQMAKDLMAQYNPEQSFPEPVEEDQTNPSIPQSFSPLPEREAVEDQPEPVQQQQKPQEQKKQQEQNLQLVKYSDRAIALIGDTKQIKDKLKELWGSYNPNLRINGQTVKGWVFSAKREPQLRQLIAS